MIRALLVVAIVTLGLAGCARAGSTPGTSLDEVAGDWHLVNGTVEGAAITIVAGTDITLTMLAPSVVGSSGCNTFGGRLALVNSEIEITDVASTAMLCPDDVMAAEVAFMRALGLVNAAERDGARLTLLGPGIELVFSED